MLPELTLEKDGGKVRSVSSFNCLELLSILNTTADDQYYRIGTRPNGETGLFPEAYVEEVQEEGPPAMAPPPLPQVLCFENSLFLP